MECGFVEPGSTPVYILIVVLLLLSAFFSASETSLVSTSKLRLRHMVDEGIKGAKALEKVIMGGKFLTAILIGNNFVNIFLTSLVTSVVTQAVGSSSFILGLTTVFVTMVILIFGEITPKSMAVRYSEKIALAVARPIQLFSFVMTPVSAFLNGITKGILRLFGTGAGQTPSITESELKTMVNVSHEEGVIDQGKSELIHNVFEFGSSDAEDIMTPRTDIVALPEDATYEEVLKAFKEEQFSRIPIYRNDIDHIVGILHIKDFVFSDFVFSSENKAENKTRDKEQFNVLNYIRDPFFSYESKQTSDLLAEMRENNVNMAVILDEYGGTSGIVSMEDLIEKIVGEIYDEYDEDEEDEIVELSDNVYSVEGGANLSDFGQKTGIELESEDYETVGGYVMGLLGHIPELGDVAEDNGIVFQVEEVSKNRIEKLKITLSSRLEAPNQ